MVCEKQLKQQIARISHYETLLERLQLAVNDGVSGETSADVRAIADALGAYYGSDDWKRDFAADEAGLLPRELKRGVLSEDGIHNALEAFLEAEACSGIDANGGGHDPMKLILCGKGGSGKSTLATLLARACAARGKQVLVIDSDESNFGLHKQLGMELPADFTHYFGHKKGIFQDGAADVFAGGWHLEDIPADYCSRDGSIRLMAIGKIAEAGEGCACAMGVLAKTFLEHLLLREDEVVIVDTEAGVEHFGRGVDKFVDAILMVADPSYESIQLAGKICQMGKSFQKPVYIVLNRVTDQQFDWMKAHMPDPDAVIAGVPMDYDVFLAGMKGEAIAKEIPGVADILEKVLHS